MTNMVGNSSGGKTTDVKKIRSIINSITGGCFDEYLFG